jgi:hypothetical protein
MRTGIGTTTPSLARRIRGVPVAVAGTSVPQTCDPSVSVTWTGEAAVTCWGANQSRPTATTSTASAAAAARTPDLSSSA